MKVISDACWHICLGDVKPLGGIEPTTCSATGLSLGLCECLKFRKKKITFLILIYGVNFYFFFNNVFIREEDKMLLQLAKTMNRNWQKISEEFTSFKNRKGCLTRYKILNRRLKDERFNGSLEAVSVKWKFYVSIIFCLLPTKYINVNCHVFSIMKPMQ